MNGAEAKEIRILVENHPRCINATLMWPNNRRQFAVWAIFPNGINHWFYSRQEYADWLSVNEGYKEVDVPEEEFQP